MRLLQIVAFIFLFAAAFAAQAEAKRGYAPPDSLGLDKDKTEIRVSDYRGKVVVMTFWATWCGYCLKELPILEKIQRKIGEERIAVVAINTDKDRDDYRAMRRRMKDFQLTMTEDNLDRSVSEEYAVSGLPHMIMIDKAGMVAFKHVGYSEELLGDIVEEINLLLEEELPSTSRATN